MNATSLLTYLFLNFFILFSIDFYLFRFFKDKLTSRFLNVFLFFIAQIIISITILGFLSVLYMPALAFSNFAFSSLVLFMSKPNKKNLKDYLSNQKKEIRSALSFLKTLSLPTKLVIAVFVLLILFIIFLGIIFPALDWDGLSYHLTFSANAIQYHSILDRPTSLLWLNGYPKAGEMFQFWNIIFLKNDIVADISQLPFLLAAVFSLYCIIKNLGIKKETAIFSSILISFIPMVIAQTKTTYVDVMMLAMFFSGVCFLMEIRKNKINGILSGISFGILLALKSTGVIFMAVSIFFSFLTYLLIEKIALKELLKNFLLVIFVALLIGSSWYIKDFILYGTPLYPFGFKIAGFQIFPGKTFEEFANGAISSLSNLPKGYFNRIFYTWTEQKDWFGCFYNYDSNFTGFGPLWFIILLPSLIVSLLYSLLKKDYKYLTAALIFLGVFFLYPNNWYPRYTLFFTGIGIISFAYISEKIKNNWRKILMCFTLFIALISLGVSTNQCYYSPKNIVHQLRTNFLKNDRPLMYDIMFTKGISYIEQNVKPNERIIYDSRPMFIYPLWKKDYSNQVIFIASKDQKDWLNKLILGNYEYAFTAIGSNENVIIKKQSQFKKVYSDEQFEIYQRK